MDVRSKINPLLSLDFIVASDEDKYFERKSARIKASDLAKHICGFANADGGTIVLGVGDKTREIEGVDFVGAEVLNKLIAVPRDCCRPAP